MRADRAASRTLPVDMLTAFFIQSNVIVFACISKVMMRQYKYTYR
jgi:hypothetical protein